MRTDAVLVTTFQREELLYLSLEAIRGNDETIPIAVFSDRGAESDELREVCLKWNSLCWSRPNHQRYGNSWNLILACQEMLSQLNISILHTIEDDTIIHPGYLKWARQQLSIPPGILSYAAVCGRIGSPHIPNWYESPCASWSVKHLRAAIALIIPEYFCEKREDMQRVLDEKMFPDSKYKKGGAEQDGFFLRCIEHYGWKTKFPPKPLATHLGWFGYNSPPARERPAGNLAQRVEACRAMLADIEQRKFLFGHRITEAEVSGMGGL